MFTFKTLNMKLSPRIIYAIIILSSVAVSCSNSSESLQREVVVLDSSRNIELVFPDSLKGMDIEEFKTDVSEYLDDQERFFLDTVSTVNLQSLQQRSKAYELRQKLIKVLPKISITSGVGDNKFTRDYYIVEGDVKLDRDELLLYCQQKLQRALPDHAEKLNSRKLTLAADRNGRPSIWPKGVVIKYSVMRSSFSTKKQYEIVVESMKEATADWMKVCNVKFEYLPGLDNQNIDVESSPEAVFFVVRQINSGGAFIAQAFFPNDPAYERMLFVDDSYFTSPYSKAGVLRHELGHVLGFRHEHIWSADASCPDEPVVFEELGALQKTTYDPYSVMHYPCGQNKNNIQLKLTDFDKAGAAKVYSF